MYPYSRLHKQLLLVVTLCFVLSTLRAQRPVCPQQGATTVTQLGPVPRPKGIATLRCDFNVPPDDPTHPDSGFVYLAWVKETTIQLYTHLYNPNNVTDEGEIHPGHEKILLNVKDNFTNLGQSLGSSVITLDVDLTIKYEITCEVLLKNHEYCMDTTRIQFQEPDIILEADGVAYCQNNGGDCGEIHSKDHNITCRVNNSDNDLSTMTLTVNGEIIFSGQPDVTMDYYRCVAGNMSASCNIPENANSTCMVTDTRGTYRLASHPDPCNPEPCFNGGTCRATSNTTFICDCLPTWIGDTCETRSMPGTDLPPRRAMTLITIPVLVFLVATAVVAALIFRKRKELFLGYDHVKV